MPKRDHTGTLLIADGDRCGVVLRLFDKLQCDPPQLARGCGAGTDRLVSGGPACLFRKLHPQPAVQNNRPERQAQRPTALATTECRRPERVAHQLIAQCAT